ncbi:competence type IV pilus minor pilin ComGD [Salibacterium halotolerans]|uniref:Competence protein ComGD n=1 Tax=Salibacterium halotolerans TaxID=1884432 RepID=A0A1I5NL40_9BACI|nr:competence type IV pilus minor pilin ComGD [Salibacterium halotolerans]SFP22437.1 competence protein ComGD [Salibacterium halotolerans]
MKHVVTAEQGHTFVEMILVLAVLSIMTAVPVLHFQTMYDKKQIDYFLEVLEEDLRAAQQLAYADQEWIYFKNTTETYSMQKGSFWEEPLQTRELPEGVSFQNNTMAFEDIGFKSNGNARKAGTVFIQTPHQSYKLVVLVGKGRIYIEKR